MSCCWNTHALCLTPVTLLGVLALKLHRFTNFLANFLAVSERLTDYATCSAFCLLSFNSRIKAGRADWISAAQNRSQCHWKLQRKKHVASVEPVKKKASRGSCRTRIINYERCSYLYFEPKILILSSSRG